MGTVSSGFREIEIGWDWLGSVGFLPPAKFVRPSYKLRSVDARRLLDRLKYLPEPKLVAIGEADRDGAAKVLREQ